MFSNIGLDAFISDDSKKFENAVFANGLWQKRKEPVGTFTLQMEKFNGSMYGLQNECQVSFESALPKIPMTILNNIHQLYLDIYKKFKSEVYVSIYWDKIKQDYFLYIPKQKVSGASVTFENNEEMMNNPDYFVVMDSHSHNVMGAFWSAQDIKDQASSRLFSVLGKITSDSPEILITAGANRQEIKLKVEDVFDAECEKLHADSDYSIPEEQLLNIVEQKYATPAWQNYYQGNKKTLPATKTGSNSSYTGNGHYYANTAKTKLIATIHSFATSFSLSSLKIDKLLVDFLEFFEEETLSKDTMYATDTKDLPEVLTNMEMQISATFDLILDQFNLREKEEGSTVDEDTDYPNSSSLPTHYN